MCDGLMVLSELRSLAIYASKAPQALYEQVKLNHFVFFLFANYMGASLTMIKYMK